METVLLLIVGLALAYVIVYTPMGNMFKGAQEAPSVQKTAQKTVQKAGGGNKISMPEDSTLKRHFLSNLQAEVESELSPRPTCSMLKRHFDSLVLAEVDKRVVVNTL